MAELTVDIKETPGAAGTATVTLAGSIDARTVISFKSQLESAKGRGARTFVLDMEKITYINSTGLSYLISLADSSDPGRPGLVLVKVQAKVKVLFDMMGLGSLFRFCASVEEAILGLGGAAPKAPEPAAAKSPTPAAVPVPPAPPPPPPPPVKAVTPAPIQAPAPPPAPAVKPPSLPAIPVPAKAATPPPVRTATPAPTAAVRISPPPTVRLTAGPSTLPPTRNEDWLSIGLAIVLIASVMAGFRPPLPSFEWASDGDFFAAAAANKARIDRLGEEAEAKGEAEMAAAAAGLRRAYERGDRGGAAEAANNLAAAADKTLQPNLRAEAVHLVSEVGAPAGATIGRVFGQRNLLNSALLGILLLILSCIGIGLMGGRLESFALGFPVLFAMGWLAQAIAGNIPNGRWGLDHALVALLLGLLAGNSLGVPAWLRESLRSEYYLKTGLVILGAGLILPDVAQAGTAGIILGAALVASVGLACYGLARLFRVDEDFSAVIAASVSLGGVPAMAASLLSVKGDRRKLPYVAFLSYAVAFPLIFLLPRLAHDFGLSDGVGGAWLGATLDTAPTVSTAGARLNETSSVTARSVKGSLDLFLPAAALLLSAVWAIRHATRLRGAAGRGLFWSLLPKAPLAFIAAALAFSFLLPPPQVEATRGILRDLRDTWFALAFVSIGMETRYGDLFRLERGRPAAAFLLSQIVNAVCALLLAWLLFGGALFSSAR